MAKDIINGI